MNENLPSMLPDSLPWPMNHPNDSSKENLQVKTPVPTPRRNIPQVTSQDIKEAKPPNQPQLSLKIVSTESSLSTELLLVDDDDRNDERSTASVQGTNLQLKMKENLTPMLPDSLTWLMNHPNDSSKENLQVKTPIPTPRRNIPQVTSQDIKEATPPSQLQPSLKIATTENSLSSEHLLGDDDDKEDERSTVLAQGTKLQLKMNENLQSKLPDSLPWSTNPPNDSSKENLQVKTPMPAARRNIPQVTSQDIKEAKPPSQPQPSLKIASTESSLSTKLLLGDDDREDERSPVSVQGTNRPLKMNANLPSMLPDSLPWSMNPSNDSSKENLQIKTPIPAARRNIPQLTSQDIKEARPPSQLQPSIEPLLDDDDDDDDDDYIEILTSAVIKFPPSRIGGLGEHGTEETPFAKPSAFLAWQDPSTNMSVERELAGHKTTPRVPPRVPRRNPMKPGTNTSSLWTPSDFNPYSVEGNSRSGKEQPEVAIKKPLLIDRRNKPQAGFPVTQQQPQLSSEFVHPRTQVSVSAAGYGSPTGTKPSLPLKPGGAIRSGSGTPVMNQVSIQTVVEKSVGSPSYEYKPPLFQPQKRLPPGAKPTPFAGAFQHTSPVLSAAQPIPIGEHVNSAAHVKQNAPSGIQQHGHKETSTPSGSQVTKKVVNHPQDTIEKKMFNILQDKETRPWHKYSSNRYELLHEKTKTVQDAELYQVQVETAKQHEKKARENVFKWDPEKQSLQGEDRKVYALTFMKKIESSEVEESEKKQLIRKVLMTYLNIAQTDVDCVLVLREEHELSECIEAVKSVGGNLQRAWDFFKECGTCFTSFGMHKLVSLPTCQCLVCTECFTEHFTTLTQTTSCMYKFACPVCTKPDLENCPSEEFQTYFSYLDAIMKNYLKRKDCELYEQKLAMWELMADKNFRWCVNGCLSGFINERGDRKVQCPECLQYQCFKCKKPWSDQHSGASCGEVNAWIKASDPEIQQQGHIAHLQENGIDCPKCKMHYEVAKGGCMHFKCLQCLCEFCCGCNLPFRSYPGCQHLSSCKSKGMHAHHPRDCLYYLRDEDCQALQLLLCIHNVNFIQATNAAVVGNGEGPVKCPVKEQHEGPIGLKDAICGKPVKDQCGLCEKHYKEYLVCLINQHNIDPVDIFDLQSLQNTLRRDDKKIPDQKGNETEASYCARLRQEVQQQLPLTPRKTQGFQGVTVANRA